MTIPDHGAKMRWLQSAMNGDNDGIMRALYEALPASTTLDANDMRRLEVARSYMGELFARGVTLNQFLETTGLTGAYVDQPQPGLAPHALMSGYPLYFRLWLAELDPTLAATGVKNLLLERRQSMQPDYVGWFRLLVYVDIDTEDSQVGMPYEAGLTPHAVCFDISLTNVEECFNGIDLACASLSKLAQRKLRIGIGSFAQQEYDGMRTHSIYTKRMVFNMGSEWLLFKNIHRRASRFGFFWKLVAKLRDRNDNG